MLQGFFNLIPKLLTGISMKREDKDDETAKQGQKEEKCHNCVVGSWLKGRDCCAGSQDKNNLHFHMLRSQCFDGSHNREYNFHFVRALVSGNIFSIHLYNRKDSSVNITP